MGKLDRDTVQQLFIDAIQYGKQVVIQDKSTHSEIMGGAYIILEVDGRSKLGKLLASFEGDADCGFSLSKSSYMGGFTLSGDGLRFMHVAPSLVACKAALEYITERLDISGWFNDYESR